MRFLEELPLSPSLITQLNPNSTAKGYGGGWVDRCHGFLHNTLLVAASLFFVGYLAYEARKSFSKLSNRRSFIMIGYYASLWLVSLLNLAWCCLQGWECSPGKEVAWNLLTLFTTSGMLFLEVSLVAFLFQGNYASGAEALTRTFLISGFVIALDLLLKAIYVFGFGVSLFIDNNENVQNWRERLPARPAFYKYITIMFALYGLYLIASAFSANGAHFGFWLYGVMSVCYHALYLPLLYITFLADFFQEEDLNLENVYYSEMKDAGFFDADWE
ncbi:hypothetical protein HID58_031904 [Brassica napus]|uniref:Transmembrane protein adipocyte-associated 1 homolog n=1 Tax=Brassica napus TaxID=3708 RepID=A0ABQ7WYG9_BRANA|nr:hypothetical protein HID58_092559 [Brassica napus]KAH0908583.1 hypothetical protein HID58_031904 [Brassica napus]